MCVLFFFFQAEDGIRDYKVTGVQTCALPILFSPGFGGGERRDAREAGGRDRHGRPIGACHGPASPLGCLAQRLPREPLLPRQAAVRVAVERRPFMTFGFTFFDQVMTFIAVVSVLGAVWTYFYTQPRKKQK